MQAKEKAAASTTAFKNTLQTRVYHSVDGKSRTFQRQNAINMTAMILLRQQAGYYTQSQQKGVWPTVNALLRSYAGGHNAA